MTAQPPSAEDPSIPDRIRLDETNPRILHVEGEANLAAVEDLADELGVDRTEIGKLFGARGVDEVDMSDATFIDSTTIALIVAIAQHRRPGQLRVTGASGSPLDTLRLTGMDAVLDLQP